MSTTTGNFGGMHLNGQPLTTSETINASPTLLSTSIDSRITKVRPMATPIDQISRLAGSQRAGSMEVAYYLVDSKPVVTTVKTSTPLDSLYPSNIDGISLKIEVDNAEIFSPSDSVLLPGHETEEGTHIAGYVSEISGNVLTVIFTDSFRITLNKGDKVVRMARAAAELDVQTPQYQAIPVRKENSCQIFKMQIEQSTLMKLADKETDWNLSEQEEAAVIDMRLAMEKNFIFGKRSRLFDKNKNQYVHLTQGIWNQAPNKVSLDLDSLTPQDFIDFAQKIFTGNSGSRKRLLIGGSDFVAAISKVALSDRICLGPMVKKWGIETREISTNFGSLYILHSEVFDQCGHSRDAFVLDQAYLTKYTHIPFHPEKLDLRASGTRNTDAVVLTEASCLVLRNPSVHTRVIGE